MTNGGTGGYHRRHRLLSSRPVSDTPTTPVPDTSAAASSGTTSSGTAGRPWDIVVFGATGFAGRLIAQYLARHLAGQPQAGLKLAIAGRGLDKLEAIRAGLEQGGVDGVSHIGIIIASVDDPASLAAMARSCRVLVTTVGPYMRHGLPVVAACVAAGTDYVDLTGEPDFVAAISERFDAEARANDSLVIPCCGFDSIPTDLGVLFTVKQLPAGLPITIEGYMQARASFSGGTFASALGAFAGLGRGRKHRPVIARDVAPGRSVKRQPARLHYQKALRRWALPMPTIDPQIALRSARARGDYGPEFRYGHYMCLKSLPQVGLTLAGVGALVALAQTRPTRKLLERLRPAGTGPSEAERQASWFKVTFFGQAGEHRVVTEVRGGDPGYDETARMAAESALCLATQREQLPHRGGVRTTAEAMGEALLARLQAAGLRFRVLAGEAAGADAT